MRASPNRFRLKLLLSLILAAAALTPVWAATLTDGELGSGSVTGSGTETFTYYVQTAGNNMTYLGMGVSTPDVKFNPQYTLKDGSGNQVAACSAGADTYGCQLQGVDYTLYGTGTYSDIAKNGLGAVYPTFSASFTMNEAESGLDYGTQVSGGGTMSTGVTYNGQLQFANYDMYSFAANSGDTPTLTMTGVSFTNKGQIRLYLPDGSYVTSWTGALGGSVTANPTAAQMSQTGDYTVVIADSLPENSPTYTLAVTNNTKLPVPPQAVLGSPCMCTAASQMQNDRTSDQPGGMSTAADGVMNGGQSSVGEPINIASGNMYMDVTDYSTVGTNPLAFIRNYNSYQYKFNLYASALGPNWRHNFDRYIRVVSSSLVQAERADGRVVNFKLVSSVWTPDADMDYKLTNSGSTYTLTDPDDTVETYAVTSGKGTLNSIAWANGYTQTLTYTSGNLTSVSDSYSRTLTLTYTSGKLTGVSTPDSATLTYGYTTSHSQNLLTSVTYNTSPSSSQTYVYGNTEYPFALTSITDENGNTN